MDGELDIWSGDRTDFAAVQRRVTVGVGPRAPACLVAFDLLQRPIEGVLLSWPLLARRELIIDPLVNASAAVALCPDRRPRCSRYLPERLGARRRH